MRQYVRESIQICPDHTLYNNAWISKQFCTAVALEEEKCHLKQGHRCQIKLKMVSNFIAGRPKAALLFWFFGGFRCGVPLFIVMLVIY